MAGLGSDTWLQADDFDEESELYIRATQFFEKIDWNNLISIASNLRVKKCELSEKYSLGHFNLVRRLTFTDGVSWIVRLRMPELPSVFGMREAMKGTDCMGIEIATMNYLRTNTDMPVPEVFAHDLTANNTVGAPYILMSYMHGTTARDLSEARDCESGVFGTPEQNERFWSQLAKYHVQLASITFDKIGSLHQDGDKFFIGPEIETGEGPWATAQEYYSALIRHRMRVAENDAAPELRSTESFSFPLKLMETMQRFESQGPTQFGLANRDFGAHNVLVDNEFNIIGIIDFDGVIAAPAATVAQLPASVGLSRPVPGHVETNEFAMAWQEKTAHLLPKYVELVRSATASQETQTGSEDETSLADDLVSESASLIQGLDEYAQHCDFVNDMWSATFDRILN